LPIELIDYTTTLIHFHIHIQPLHLWVVTTFVVTCYDQTVSSTNIVWPPPKCVLWWYTFDNFLFEDQQIVTTKNTAKLKQKISAWMLVVRQLNMTSWNLYAFLPSY